MILIRWNLECCGCTDHDSAAVAGRRDFIEAGDGNGAVGWPRLRIGRIGCPGNSIVTSY